MSSRVGKSGMDEGKPRPGSADRCFPVCSTRLRYRFDQVADVTDAGILTTQSNLLFSGGREGYFVALDARNGELLWKASVGGAVTSGPMSYSVGGRQYVAVTAGNSLFAFALRQQ